MGKELTESAREQLLAQTAETAVALSDDLKHIRETLSKKSLRPSDIRRLSAQMRRFLVDGDLRKVAAPRVGRLVLHAPQLRPFHHANEQEPLFLFSGGKLEFPHMQIGDMHMGRTRIGPIGDPDEMVELTIDQFCAQRVICHEGQWVTRQQVVQYVANTAGGVHSDSPREPSHKRLDALRGFAGVRVTDGFATLEVNTDAMGAAPQPWKFDKNRIDFALLQLMSSAQYMERSEAVKELEAIIDAE